VLFKNSMLFAATSAFSLLAAQEIFQFSDNGSLRRFELEPPTAASAKLRAAKGDTAPVFYDLSELPPRDRLNRMSIDDRAKRMEKAARKLTNRVLVKDDSPERLEALRAATSPTKEEASLLKGWTLFHYESPEAAMKSVRWLAGQSNWQFLPILSQQQAKRQTPNFGAALQRIVNDPLYPKQWHLSGPIDIGMRAAWDYVTGKGINVTIVDDGMEVNHPDLRDASYPLNTGYHRNFNEGPADNPTPLAVDQNHGTNCAGLVGARGFNGIGLAGVAPEARLMGLRLIAGESAPDSEGIAFAWQPEGVTTHVSSNSWGPKDDGKASGRISAVALVGQELAATRNRNALGTVIVISAGNGAQEGDNSSYDAYSSSRFGISVGAVNRKFEPSSFSEPGVAVAVSAFGGEYNPPEVLWTTNNSGTASLAALKEKFETSDAPVDYSDAFNGTSAAAPQVSGAAALLLERNPNLGYRDVKEILMRSARRQGLVGGDEFVQNGAGFFFSHSFGAGLLNVAGALALADGWRNLGPLATASSALPGINTIIPDNGRLDVSFEISDNIRVEHVEFTVDVEHPHRGDLGFVLASPRGTLSVVAPRSADDTADFDNFTFTTVRNWGESSRGTWILRAADTAAGDVGGLRSASIKIYGTAQ
jgi:subtilisin family serine protease